MAKRQVFYSFHYRHDCWRAAQVRNIGTIEGNKPAPDNEWEEITSGGEDAIKRWISDQMKYRSCTIVLIGSKTANRKWINYEIIKSWNEKMGVVGLYIHGLKDSDGYISIKGENPFGYIIHNKSGKKLSEIARCYDPPGGNSKEKYNWISEYISSMVEEALKIRENN